jgi:hypothetical protein
LCAGFTADLLTGFTAADSDHGHKAKDHDRDDYECINGYFFHLI